MFRMWCKIFSENRLVKDTVIEDSRTDVNRTKKVLEGLEKASYIFDLAVPIWLDSNIEAFKRFDKVRFIQDNYIDTIDFDYLEIHVIEED